MEAIEQLALDLNDESMVYQDNMFVLGSYDLTALEQKLLLILISTIRKDDDGIVRTRFRVSDLADVLNVSCDNLYRDLPKVCRSLVSKTVEIKQENGSWKIFNIVSFAEYISKQGVVILEINKKAEEYLLQLQDFFTSFKLSNALTLDSKYAIRMYQISKSSLYKKGFTIDLDDFKKTLKINSSAYSRFNNITSRILKPSIQEINDKTDINVDYETITVGRKVVGLKFAVESSEKPSREVKTTKRQSEKKTAFNSYNQREYSEEQHKNIEWQLLGWDKD